MLFRSAATGAPAFNALPENGANQVWYRTYVTERDWSSYHVPDPRPSLGERYRDHAEYVGKVRAAASALERAGYLLGEDVQRIAEQAAAAKW